MRRDGGQLFGVPPRVAGAADQSAGQLVDRLEPSERPREARRDLVDRRLDDTSTSYSQPTARCSSSTATGSRSAGRDEGLLEQLASSAPGRSGRPAARRPGGTGRAGTSARGARRRPRGRRRCPTPTRPRSGSSTARCVALLQACTRAVVMPDRAGRRRGRGPGRSCRRTASAWAATGSGSARTILPSALPTGSTGRRRRGDRPARPSPGRAPRRR